MAILIVSISACGDAGGPSSAGPTPSPSVNATTVTSSAVSPVTALPVPAVTASSGSGPATTQAPGASPATDSALFTGYVMQVYSTGDFVLSVGPVTYTVVMSPTTVVVNLRGRQVPRQFIQVAESVEVTGMLAGSKISAQSVLVPTSKDDA